MKRSSPRLAATGPGLADLSSAVSAARRPAWPASERADGGRDTGDTSHINGSHINDCDTNGSDDIDGRGWSQMIVVTGQDGTRHEFGPTVGKALMWQLRPLKAGVVGLCNGNAACGTCHVYVREDWLDRLPGPDEYEQEMLGEVRLRRSNSRLSCQIEYGPELDGLELTVAPRA
ncbi:2Fe-2S iron-sulfur cluster-binding protein [Parafrankia sp. EUN1f]|uniref:2Fe-2S iron-sulfur cluster-binding protein n=1 Tax=Parafrankia sp. EUN1f TaxID=102897 RepID=UPI000305C62E|nr:2Fe-2S iron-sulfur cluster-binding protein [Parafrankia sp. EUN1f]